MRALCRVVKEGRSTHSPHFGLPWSMPARGIPRFRLWPVLIWGLLIYLVMAMFFGIFFVMSDMLKYEAVRASAAAGPRPGLGWTSGVELATLVLGLGLVTWWHAPLKHTLVALTRGQAPRPKDLEQAQKRIFRSPLVVGIGLPAALGLVLIAFSLGHMSSPAALVHELPPEARSLPINLMFLALSGFFSYLWQRHRIQTRYLIHLFTPTELATRLPPTGARTIGHTLWVLAVLSALLPVGVVLTLLGTGVTRIADTTSLSATQWSIILGSETLGQQAPVLLRHWGIEGVPVLLINTIDTWRIVIGSVLGVAFMLGYLFFVFRWVAGDLTSPVYTLRDAMKRVEEGHRESPQPVVTGNEIGELTLGFNRMMKGLDERDRIKGLFGQYLTREVSEAILDGRVKLGGDRYEVTVMFTDIRDFTALSDRLQPEEVFGFLNEYLDAMIEVLVAKGGFIDKFLGDGILTVFGLPVRSEDHALAAFEAAQAMQATLVALNQRRSAEGKVPIAIGSGLHSGPVIAGNVGSSRKLQFTVIGDTVNLASRLEGLNKRYGSALTLSDSTWQRLPETLRSSLPFIREEGVEIRGKRDPVTLYRLGG